MTETLKVILPAGDIPLKHALVTKIKGTKEYKLVSEINVFEEGSPRRPLKATDGSVFMISLEHDPENINAIGLDKELVWHCTLEELNKHLYQGDMQ